jgi:hypothetical protein
MNHKQNRTTLLEQVGSTVPSTKRGPTKASVTPHDYLAVPPPFNLAAQPAGDCLIWLWTLNRDGYGVASFPSAETLAHRQAFRQSRKRPSKMSILHLCHRPYCVQPSHLYEGTAKDNTEDRKLRLQDGINLSLTFRKHDVVQRVAQYRWDSPVLNQKPLLPSPEAGLHDCNFVIHANNRLICSICGNPGDPNLHFKTRDPEFQPPQADRNSHDIVNHHRTITDLDNGLVCNLEATSTINVPTNRAERRRRDREIAKHPITKPILLAPPVTFDPANPQPIHLDLSNAPKFLGTGMIVVTAQPIPRDPFGPSLE